MVIFNSPLKAKLYIFWLKFEICAAEVIKYKHEHARYVSQTDR